MSDRDIHLLLLDIDTAISRILEYTDGMGFEDYESDYKTKDAVERNFEIIGEASSRIPAEFKKEHNDIEWRILKDFRNFIIHEYFGVDNQMVWNTIQYRIPELKVSISELTKK